MRFLRVIAVICIGLWLAGSVTVMQGTLAPQWTAPHCPEGQAQGSQQGHNHCAWHCDGIDTPLSTGRSGCSSPAPVGDLIGSFIRTPLSVASSSGVAPRGPPQFAVLFS
ncbi:MAG: hypothetical protein HP493_14990 [Nitrospira sp.]|nr:hypothetical protein [Nitrospira sp.]